MPLPPKLYGTWSSPISPRAIGAAARLLDVQWDRTGTAIVWLEQRAGVSSLMMQSLAEFPPEAPRLLTEVDQVPRARIGYGGGDFTLANGKVCFAGNKGCLYLQALDGGPARPITPAFGQAASPALSPDGAWVAYVHEYDRVDTLAVAPTNGGGFPVKLVGGDDFYMQPAWHPDGTRLAYIAWNHPHMPWDATELRLCTLAPTPYGPTVTETHVIAGGADVSIFQPEFSPDGRYLAYVSDAAGWWQLYVCDLSTGEHRRLTTDEAEYGQPAWIHGLRMYGWTDSGRALIALRNQNAALSAWRIDVVSGHSRPIPTAPYTNLWQISVHPKRMAFAALAAAPTIPDRVVLFDAEPDIPLSLSPVSAGETPGIIVMADDARDQRILHRAATENLTSDDLSAASPVTWTSFDGGTAHGLYYPPASRRFVGPATGDGPPLIVHVHGGPTSQVRQTYSAEMQFYATRGYAVLQVNHRGGTGYGKPYKDLGRGAWGTYEVEDSVFGAEYLASQGLADLRKVVILGSSSGGFAVLHALVTRPGFFRAGVCSAGIANQFSLLKDGLDKFEERYSETIVGRLPEALDNYRARSPLFHTDKIRDPLLLSHGVEDSNVPAENSQQIAAALQRRGIPCELLLYPGEGHSLRKPENVEDFYTKVLAFLMKHVIYA